MFQMFWYLFEYKMSFLELFNLSLYTSCFLPHIPKVQSTLEVTTYRTKPSSSIIYDPSSYLPIQKTCNFINCEAWRMYFRNIDSWNATKLDYPAWQASTSTVSWYQQKSDVDSWIGRSNSDSIYVIVRTCNTFCMFVFVATMEALKVLLSFEITNFEVIVSANLRYST